MEQEIREALKKATPGPWEQMNNRDIFAQSGAANRAGVKADENDGWHIADTLLVGITYVNGEEKYLSGDERMANTNLIANAPTYLEWCLSQIAELQEKNERLEQEYSELQDQAYRWQEESGN